MYIFEGMIELGLKEGEKWTSRAHRTVAINTCLCNPRIHDRETLMYNVELINKIPKEKIKKVTAIDLFDMGVMV